MKTAICPDCGARGTIPVDYEITMCAFGRHRVEKVKGSAQ